MSTIGSALRICAVRRTGPVKMLLAEVALLLFCLALAGAGVTRVKLEREREPPRTRAEWCDASGGSCVPREDCLPDTHIVASFCRYPVSVCCLPKKLLCESVYSGYCTSDLSGCRAKTTHHVSELRCDDDHKCCVPDEVLRRRQDHGGGHWGGGWNWGGGHRRDCGGYGCSGYGYGQNPYPQRGGYGPNPYPQPGNYRAPGWPVRP